MQDHRYSSSFKAQALSKALQRGTRTLVSVATELNLSVGTLIGWLKAARRVSAEPPHAVARLSDVPAHQWNASRRLLALHESHALSGSELHAWCRGHGLFEHQLKQWRDAFYATTADHSTSQREANTALRELQGQHEQLQRELRRKEKALAEAAALLVLQKKFQALCQDADL